eukprot:NODE_38_length_35257_cov_0.939047.p11 type:complete len:287 gc:universal NODE_38_length_35257_cov_0.939047:16560-15700(-)
MEDRKSFDDEQDTQPQKFRFSPQFNLNHFPPCVVRPFTFRLPIDNSGSTIRDAYLPYEVQEYEERTYIVLLFLKSWLELDHLRATVDKDLNSAIIVSGQVKLPVLQYDFMQEHVDLYNTKDSGLVLEWGITSLFRNLRKVGQADGNVLLEFTKEIETGVPLDHADAFLAPQPSEEEQWKVVEFPPTGLWPPNSKDDSEILYWVFKRIESPVTNQAFAQQSDTRSEQDQPYSAPSYPAPYRYRGRARYRTTFSTRGLPSYSGPRRGRRGYRSFNSEPNSGWGNPRRF